MATLSLTSTLVDSDYCQINWNITGINVPACSWVGISKVVYSSLPPNDYLGYMMEMWDTSPISGSGLNGYASGNFLVDKSIYPSSFSCYGVARSISDDAFYSAGGFASVNTVYPATRPSQFLWSYAKNQGGDFNLKADEWNSFMDNINLVRSYKGYGQIWYTTASIGSPFTSNMYDQAHSAVNEMYNYMSAQGKSYINSITSTGWNTGQIITANHLNYIVSALNSIT